MRWTIGKCPKVYVMLVIKYELLFYATNVLEPSYRPHYLLWVYHVLCVKRRKCHIYS